MSSKPLQSIFVHKKSCGSTENQSLENYNFFWIEGRLSVDLLPGVGRQLAIGRQSGSR